MPDHQPLRGATVAPYLDGVLCCLHISLCDPTHTLLCLLVMPWLAGRLSRRHTALLGPSGFDAGAVLLSRPMLLLSR